MIGYHKLADVDDLPIGEGHHYPFEDIQGVSIYIQGQITGILDIPMVISDYGDNHSQMIKDLYEKYGDTFYKYLDGNYIVFLKHDQKLKIFNNRYHATNLFYFYNESYFIYSKTFKALLDILPVDKIVNKSVLKTFLSNGWNPSDKTMIEGVYKILPTYSLLVEKTVEIVNHWSEELNFNRRPFENLDSQIEKYEELYQRGIEEFTYQKKTNELGTLLSGGHDTSFALIQGSKVHDKPMHSFTVTFPGWAFDEGPFARNLSKKFGSIHHEVPFTPKDLDHMPSLIIASEEPVVGSSLPLHLCSAEASRHVDTMLAGDGGDTMWGEYFPVAEVHKYIHSLPLGARKAIHGISKKLRDVFDWERFWELEHVTGLFAKEDMYDGFLRRLCTYRHFDDQFIDKLLVNTEFEKIDFARSSLELKYNSSNFSDMLIESKLFNGFYNYQSFHTHRSMQFHGLDLYLPTINRDLLRFITDLPNEWVNGGTSLHRLTNSHSINRRFHKKVLSKYLKKEEIFNRSFDIPWYNILKPRRDLLLKLKARLVLRGWYNESILDEVFSDFLNQKVKDYELLELKHHGYRIFTLLSLEIWCMEFLDNKKNNGVEGEVSLEDYLSL